MNTELQKYLEALGPSARDARINLESILSGASTPGLDARQVRLIALACSYGVAQLPKLLALDSDLTETEIQATKTASALMAMNNVYYRTTHLLNNAEISQLPAKLRMTGMQNSGVDLVSFELMSFAISAIAGCSVCLQAHEKTLLKHELVPQALHSAIRIAAIVESVKRCEMM